MPARVGGSKLQTNKPTKGLLAANNFLKVSQYLKGAAHCLDRMRHAPNPPAVPDGNMYTPTRIPVCFPHSQEAPSVLPQCSGNEGLIDLVYYLCIMSQHAALFAETSALQQEPEGR
ncbi:hypothetical protein NDU88_005950 [Pleurodeles waltl]|uniref:Uncharacterized protein n=1 Tax=Pleurodeles waltl TaxID=8319 RepID=A0AAV7QG77_PLEWA|nr:hypothetical protein NDU88_005950 [Pleurodeles waltl]